MHLPCVRMRKFSDLQINDHQTAEPTVKEEQVDAIPFLADAKPFLSADKCEVAAEFHQEILQPADESFLKITLGVFIFQTEEFEDVGIFNCLFRRYDVLRLLFCAALKHDCLLPRQSGAFEEARRNLPVKLAHGPPAA